MAEKKDRGRFSIGFNEHDPSHAEVIRILEKQGKRRKAQFIVNAVLHYVRCTGTPDVHTVSAVDRAAIEEIVMGILKEQRMKPQGIDAELVVREGPQDRRASEKAEYGTEEPAAEPVDASVLALIADTMSAFRGQ